MKLSTALTTALDQVLAGGSRQDRWITVSAGELRLRIDAVQIESLGCTVREIVLEAPDLSGESLDRLRQISGTLTARLTYLLEPLAPIESDVDRCTVQLRSNPPHRDGRDRTYYELLVSRGGGVRLCRFEKRPGAARSIVPAQFTREVLARLADDMAEAATA